MPSWSRLEVMMRPNNLQSSSHAPATSSHLREPSVHHGGSKPDLCRIARVTRAHPGRPDRPWRASGEVPEEPVVQGAVGIDLLHEGQVH